MLNLFIEIHLRVNLMFILAKFLSLNRISLFLEDCQYTGRVYKNTINLFLYTLNSSVLI